MNKHTLAVRELELTPEQQKERRIQLIAMQLRAQFPRLNKKRAHLVEQDADPLAKKSQISDEDALVAAVADVQISKK